MVPACTGWFMIFFFCEGDAWIFHRQWMGPHCSSGISLLCIIFSHAEQAYICAHEKSLMPRTMGKKTVYTSQPWEAVKFTAHVIFLT